MSARRERDRRPAQREPEPEQRTALEVFQEDGPLGFAQAYRVILFRGVAALVAVIAVVAIAVSAFTGEDREGQQAIFVGKAQQLCSDASERTAEVASTAASSATPSATPSRDRQRDRNAEPTATPSGGTGLPSFSGEEASQNASVRLKLSSDLSALLPRQEQRGNLRRLRAQLERRSRIETQIASLRREAGSRPSAEERKRLRALQSDYTGTMLVLQALSGALDVPACGEV